MLQIEGLNCQLNLVALRMWLIEGFVQSPSKFVFFNGLSLSKHFLWSVYKMEMWDKSSGIASQLAFYHLAKSLKDLAFKDSYLRVLGFEAQSGKHHFHLFIKELTSLLKLKNQGQVSCTEKQRNCWIAATKVEFLTLNFLLLAINALKIKGIHFSF